MSLKVLLYRLNTFSDECIPPLSLGYLAAHAHNHEVHIIDGLKENLSDRNVIARCLDLGVDVLGVSVMTKDLPQSRALIGKAKSAIPDLVTVLGGIQPTLMPRETLEFCGVAIDFVFSGEAEISFPLWLDALEKGQDFEKSNIPGLVWRRQDGSVEFNAPSIVQNADEIGFPRWDLMPPASYRHAPHGAFMRQEPVAPIIASRGCPFACAFCCAPVTSNHRIRFRSVENLFEEIDLLYHTYGVRELHFEDDNFTLKTDFVLEFCDRLRSTGYNLTFAFPNGIRLDTVDRGVLSALRLAGAYALNFGIESGDDETLRRINKKLSTAQIREKIKMVKEYGFFVGGFFIIGFPWETEESILKTFEFAKSLDLDAAGFSYFQPFPGTQLCGELIEGNEFTIDLTSFPGSLHDITYTPRALSREKLRRLRNKGMRSYYLRPKTLWGIIRTVVSAGQLYYMGGRGIRWLTK